MVKVHITTDVRQYSNFLAFLSPIEFEYYIDDETSPEEYPDDTPASFLIRDDSGIEYEFVNSNPCDIDEENKILLFNLFCKDQMLDFCIDVGDCRYIFKVDTYNFSTIANQFLSELPLKDYQEGYLYTDSYTFKDSYGEEKTSIMHSYLFLKYPYLIDFHFYGYAGEKYPSISIDVYYLRGSNLFIARDYSKVLSIELKNTKK